MKRIVLLAIVAILLLAIMGCQSSKGAEKLEEVPSLTQSVSNVKTVSVGKLEMDYIVFGNGEKSFVILPGLSVHSVMCLEGAIIEAYKDFAEDYTVYLFDRARNIKEGYTIKAMADDTATAMKALGIENADIFGASQGGMIALYLAIDYPELVHKLVLGSTLAKPNDTFLRVVAEWISLAKAMDEEGLLSSFVDNVYSESTLKSYREVLITSNLGISDEEYERFIILAEACKTFDCYDELLAIKCPTLVLGSEGDCVVTVEGSKEIDKAIGAECYIYDDSYGHGVYDEALDYKQRCLDFFKK